MDRIDVPAFKMVFSAWAGIMRANKDLLVALDGVAGDSDLGLTMADGFAAAAEYAQSYDGTDLGNLLYFAGKAILSRAPSSLGTLLGSGFLEAGKRFKGQTDAGLERLYEFFEAIEAGVQNRGRAQVGDKTFLDGLHPAIDAAKNLEPGGPPEAMQAVTAAAINGAKATVGIVAKHGRMAIRGEASRAYTDPGAVVAALLVKGLMDTLEALASNRECYPASYQNAANLFDL